MKHIIISACCVFYKIELLTCSNSQEHSEDPRNESFNVFYKEKYALDAENQDQYAAEKEAGDITDLFGANVHLRQPNVYQDLGRRFMSSSGLQKRRNNINKEADRFEPVKAPPELVVAIARESAKQESANAIDPNDDIIRKKILRTGDYWDSVWVENVDDPSNTFDSRKDQSSLDLGSKLATVKAKITPGSKLYKLISVLKQVSPRLVYVINTPE